VSTFPLRFQNISCPSQYSSEGVPPPKRIKVDFACPCTGRLRADVATCYLFELRLAEFALDGLGRGSRGLLGHCPHSHKRQRTPWSTMEPHSIAYDATIMCWTSHLGRLSAVLKNRRIARWFDTLIEAAASAYRQHSVKPRGVRCAGLLRCTLRFRNGSKGELPSSGLMSAYAPGCDDCVLGPTRCL
jgi:hypothetical protein